MIPFDRKYNNSMSVKMIQHIEKVSLMKGLVLYHQFRARRALSLFSDVSFKTRRVLSLSNVYDDSALLVLNGTLLNIVNAIPVLSLIFCKWDMN